MGKVYYNQNDRRWKSHPYTAPGYPNATTGTSGCGPTCAAMVVSSCKETIYPNQMCDISKENGFRVPGGTSNNLMQYVSQRWGIEMKTLSSSFEAHQACKEGYFVVILCGKGLWTTGGHFILAVGADDNRIEIYDPYLYNGKFNINGRAGKLDGNSAWVEINTFKANSNARFFWAFKVNEIHTSIDQEEQPTVTEGPVVRYVNTSSANLNVRNNPNGSVVGSLQKGTQVLVYENISGWSKIGKGKWVSSQYLADSKLVAQVVPTTKNMIVNTSSANLNVRNNPNGKVTGQLSKGTKVVVAEEKSGWSRITSPVSGWVSSQYLANEGTAIKVEAKIPNTVGQVKRFKGNTIIYENSNLTGKQYTYRSNTSIKILQNISKTVDKVYVIQTKRIGYVNKNSYK